MEKNLFIGNLSYSVDSDKLRGAFESYGEVKSARVVNDRMTGRSKGFGFVEMETEDQAKAAIEALDSKEFEGRPMVVKEANPRPQRNQ